MILEFAEPPSEKVNKGTGLPYLKICNDNILVTEGEKSYDDSWKCYKCKQ